MTTRHVRTIALPAALVLAGVLSAQTPPVTINSCSFSGTRNAHIAWTNGSTEYTGIQISIDDIPAPESPLPGTAASYDSAQLGPGEHTFTLRPFIGIAYAEPRSCAATAELPPPVNLACAAAPDAWAAELAWTNQWAYSSVTILRDGFLVATLAGAPRAYTDALPAPGVYAYEVRGTLSGFDSAAVACQVENMFVSAVTIASIACSASRAAALAWTNGAPNYEGIELAIDGAPAPQSPLPGDAQAYDSAPLAPGPHTLTLRPFIGIYRAEPVAADVEVPLPPPSGLTCVPAPDAWTIRLAWANEWTYDSLVLTRDGAALATLSGGAVSYDDALPGPEAHTYAVHAVLGGLTSLPAACSAENSYVPPIALSSCAIAPDRSAHLSWTNGVAAYTSIRLLIDGAPAPGSPLPGTTTTYNSAPLAPGMHAFALYPSIDGYEGSATLCSATAVLPEPYDLACTVADGTWRVELRWFNGWPYDQVAITRNGAVLVTLDGPAASFDDDLPALGSHVYQVIGILGAQSSAPAGCEAAVSVVPSVTAVSCDIDTARIAHLAWTNGDARYEGIDIILDGAVTADSPLPPDAASYMSAVLAPGPHAFAVRPYAGATTAEPAACAADAPPPPPYGASCAETEPFWRVQISWSNAFAYDAVKIVRNGAEIATLPGDAIQFVDAVPGPGTYAYLIYGTLGPRGSEALACTIEIAFVPPVALSSCAAGDARILHAVWENGAAGYEGIEVLIDGAPAPDSPLPGGATAYATAPLDPGAHTLTLIPFIGTFRAEAASCEETTILPAPESFACAPSDVSWDVALTWTAAWEYGSVTIARDGLPLATLPGAPESYIDSVPGNGTYTYDVYASLGTLYSETVRCVAVMSTVPPVTIDACSCNAERIAHVAWTGALQIYDGIEIAIDGAVTADSPLPGAAASYDSPALDPGPHTIAVRPFIGAERARDAECLVTAPPIAPADMVCRARAGAWIVDLTWTNMWTYDSVTIFRNGEAVATLPGSSVSYADEVPGLGMYAYIAAGNLGDMSANASGCIARVTFVPAPEELACTPLGMQAHLAWRNPIAYDEIAVLRDGAVLAVLPGSAVSFDDTLADLASHEYVVAGVLGVQTGAPAMCTVRATDVPFVRGDVNADGAVDIADAIALLNYLFRSGRTPPCMESANLNDDGAADIADAIYALTYLFREGQAPKAPFPGCGPDSTGGGLGCLSFPPCTK